MIRRKLALETELEKRNEKLKRLNECGHTVDNIFTVTVCTNYEPPDEEKEDRSVSDVSSVNLELPSNISFGNSNENLMNEEPTKSDANTQTSEKLKRLNLIIFSKRQLNKNLSLRRIS